MKKTISITILLILITLSIFSTTTYAATLGNVYNLKVTVDENDAYLKWSSVTNADGYDIYINISNEGYKYLGSIKGTSALITNLEEDETYYAKVRAYELNNSGKKVVGSFSSAVKIEVDTEDSNVSKKLNKITTLGVTQSNEKVKLSWTKVDGAEGYEIFVNYANTGFKKIGTTTSNSVNIINCKAGTTYEFKVRAYKNKTYGEFSSSKKITIVDNTKPDQVIGVVVDSVIGNKAYVSWSSVSNADGYKVWLAEKGGTYKCISTVTEKIETITGLKEGKTYYVRVSAYKIVDGKQIEGEKSLTAGIITIDKEEEEETVSKVTTLNASKSGTKIKLNWTRISNADGYEIYVKIGNATYKKLGTTTSNSVNIINCKEDTTYTFKVRAFNEDSYGEFSPSKRVRFID